MWSNKSLIIVVLVGFVFLGGATFAECPSADLTGDCKVDLEDFAIMASQWLTEGEPYPGMTWVSISDSGVPGHESFTGQMSKYETTNAQYCEYLNAAKTDGQITVYDNIVYATSDTSHSQPYFDTYAADSDSQITYSGGTFSVRTRDGYSMANHPVVEVSWYGATAFCNYYGYRLPTEWEWQAVADYDGTYVYGCGTTIDQTKANYYDNGYANPLGLSSVPYTSPVDHYSSYGHGMNDMAGNVWEWTSTISGSDRVIRGGEWSSIGDCCTVAYRGIDYPGVTYDDFGFRVCRDTPDITWVSIVNDPGVPDHEAFNGEMSKYETTNAQYCQYLNAAKASNDITVSGDYVTGTSGPYSGQNYYYLAGPGSPYDGATNGGAARINWTGSSFTVDSGFENHPVTYVSWYGATAFASYYGWRLPTEWEWQAVADYNGSYTYGCGMTINNGMANYYGSTHPNGTTVVGAFGTYGYGMCDMAGNVWEWTSSCYYGDCDLDYRVIRGGCWLDNDGSCEVSNRDGYDPRGTREVIGFRACR